MNYVDLRVGQTIISNGLDCVPEGTKCIVQYDNHPNTREFYVECDCFRHYLISSKGKIEEFRNEF